MGILAKLVNIVFLHNFYNILIILFVGAFFVTWFAMAFYSNLKPQNGSRLSVNPFVAGGVVTVAVLAIGVDLMNIYFTNRARSSIQTRLEHIGSPYSVRINSTTVQNPEAIVAMLKGIGDEFAHHSHPEKRFLVYVEGKGGSVTIILNRDSGRRTEYWVYLPDDGPIGNPPGGREIGHITTPLLDGL